jgi:hypothetical protein
VTRWNRCALCGVWRIVPGFSWCEACRDLIRRWPVEWVDARCDLAPAVPGRDKPLLDDRGLPPHPMYRMTG